MRRVRAVVDRLLESALVLLMTVMVLNVLWQVFTRFVLGRPSSFTEELARYLLIWVGLLGAGYAVGGNLHLAIDVFRERLTGRWRQYSQTLVQVSIFLFALFVMVIGGLRLVYITLTLQQVSAALQIKLGYVYLALPVSGLFILFYSGQALWESNSSPGRRPGSEQESTVVHGMD